MEFASTDEEKHWVTSCSEIWGEILVILSSNRVLHELISKFFGDGNYSIHLYLCMIQIYLEEQTDVSWRNKFEQALTSLKKNCFLWYGHSNSLRTSFTCHKNIVPSKHNLDITIIILGSIINKTNTYLN